MDSIIFSHIKAIAFPCLFLIFAIGLIRKGKKDWISVCVGIVFILFGIKLGYNWIKYPSFSDSKKYYQEFKSLKKESIQKIVLETKLINRQKTKNIKRITDRKTINKIFNSIDENESVILGFERWILESSYYLDIVANKNTYKFYVEESEDNRSYISLIYNRNNENADIGEYRNPLIKKLNLLE